jgi:O-acetylhomoserine (thiol)-lyase
MTNIGDTRSMIIHPGTTTHLAFAEERKARLGIHPGLVRVSIGLESVADLITDLRNGLGAVRAAARVPDAATAE